MILYMSHWNKISYFWMFFLSFQTRVYAKCEIPAKVINYITICILAWLISNQNVFRKYSSKLATKSRFPSSFRNPIDFAALSNWWDYLLIHCGIVIITIVVSSQDDVSIFQCLRRVCGLFVCKYLPARAHAHTQIQARVFWSVWLRCWLVTESFSHFLAFLIWELITENLILVSVMFLRYYYVLL